MHSGMCRCGYGSLRPSFPDAVGRARAGTDRRDGGGPRTRAGPQNRGDALMLNATFEFEMPQALEEAVQKGIALYFNIEFELFRKRWYWFDRRVAASTLTYRLSYSPLTRQYRLARGGLSQSFESLDEALALLKSVRNWRVVDKSALNPREEYDAQVRMRLDVNQLPKPFQVNAITSREWTLASDWREVPVTAELTAKAPMKT